MQSRHERESSRHGVEGPDVGWILVQHEKIRAVFLFHHSSQGKLLDEEKI
jgi:hypothetical protein